MLAAALLPLLRRIDPERAHGIALHALRFGLGGRSRDPDDPALAITVLGRRFANPIGLAAGFDKGAVAAKALMRLGFGFVETGTVTPLPQPGNPRPRLFRLEPDRAVINRLGFNNAGLDAYLRQLAGLADRPVPLGANVGINKEGADPVRDYPALIAAVAPYADYAVINIILPEHARPARPAKRGQPARHPVRRCPGRHPSADIGEDCARPGSGRPCCRGRDLCRPWRPGIDRRQHDNFPPRGFAVPARPRNRRPVRTPLFALSTTVLARAFVLAQGRLSLIGTGGVSGSHALTKIRAGASLVQRLHAVLLTMDRR